MARKLIKKTSVKIKNKSGRQRLRRRRRSNKKKERCCSSSNKKKVNNNNKLKSIRRKLLQKGGQQEKLMTKYMKQLKGKAVNDVPMGAIIGTALQGLGASLGDFWKYRKNYSSRL